MLIGASTDSEYVHHAWRSTKDELKTLPFPMLSDLKRQLSTDLGILEDYGEYGWLARRVTFLLDADGVVQQVWDVTDAEAHPAEVLDAVNG